jgi:cell division septum initiation protein DivIVA
MMEILLLIDRLESLIGESQRLPLTSKRMLDETPLLNLIDQMRVSVPVDIREAQRILSESEAQLEAASQEAQLLLTEAEKESKRRVDESHLLSEAEVRAEQLVDEARENASRLRAEAEETALRARSEADEYALQVLSNLHNQLLEFSTSVQRGIELLKRSEGQS